MNRLIALSFVAITVSGCKAVVPFLGWPEDRRPFESVQQGQVPVSAIPAFTDCLMDGFEKAHRLFNITARQQRRAGGYRVESLVGGTKTVIFADVVDNGRVELYEVKPNMLDLSRERATFARCLDVFRSAS